MPKKQEWVKHGFHGPFLCPRSSFQLPTTWVPMRPLLPTKGMLSPPKPSHHLYQKSSVPGPLLPESCFVISKMTANKYNKMDHSNSGYRFVFSVFHGHSWFSTELGLLKTHMLEHLTPNMTVLGDRTFNLYLELSEVIG